MDYDSKQIIRKVTIRVFIFAAALAFIVWLWGFLHNGRIVLSTNNQSDTITLEKITKNGTVTEKIAESTGEKLSVVVPSGTYRAKVGGKLKTVAKTIELKAMKTEEHTLDTPELQPLEPVAPIAGSDAEVIGSEIVYLSPSGNLLKISGNLLREQLGNTIFANISWGGSGFGIGQDIKGSLYSIAQGQINPLDLPDQPEEGELVNYAVSKGNSIYVSVGPDIYFRSQQGSYKKIYTSPVQSPRLAASDSRVAVYSSPPIGEGHDGEDGGKALIEIVNTDSTKIASKDIPAFKLEWSPNGEKLAAIDYFGQDYIYDASLETKAVLPDEGVQNIIWLDDINAVYSSEGLLWSYNAESGTSNMLAFLTAGSTFTDMSVDSAGDYLYLNASSSERKSLKRLGLKGQKSPDGLAQLGALLPTRVGDCLIGYLNFTQRNIIVTPEPGIDNNLCITVAGNELNKLGVPANIFNFVIGQHEE